MKTYYLNIEQRNLLVEALLSTARAIKTDCSKRGVGGEAMPDSCKSSIQNYEHLAALFKVEEYES